MQTLNYTPTERIIVNKTVDRLNYILSKCLNKVVLDLGCFDETATIKENSGNYLFEEISKVSSVHIGIDNSSLLPEEGIKFGEKAEILFGSVYDLDKIPALANYNFDVIVAGELIEHLPDTLRFLNDMKRLYSGKKLICSTPNTTSLSNILLSVFNRESCHIDHLQVYSFKTLTTLCRLAGFKNWAIFPYHVRYTEMIMAAKQPQKTIVKASESIINGLENIFPMMAGGYILEIEL
ncbi:hypothetical protein A5893_01515 [Pedobacter psychrophilus]|uniref:Methyltransferase type 11 domain-containing protein n=1 Tax=Pedobacter psychrophilus TaxID=1826909 RepID=A0A179DLX3_9SPHI|nr:methyltransferase domain-containing protein [Pedobacter psychrophilus]OAQ41822.1 hypothetical protein A5893_01515 [Pedobacter psychrophilus]